MSKIAQESKDLCAYDVLNCDDSAIFFLESVEQNSYGYLPAWETLEGNGLRTLAFKVFQSIERDVSIAQHLRAAGKLHA